MERVLTFKTVAYDTVSIPQGELTAPVRLFDSDGPGGTGSIVSTNEEVIVRWIFQTKVTRELLLEQLQAGASPDVYLCVRDPIITNSNTKPGDIDVLIVPDDLHRAIALEVKRVKVVALDLETGNGDKVNKIQELGAGVSQVNALSKMGFSLTYLVVLIQMDGRQRKSENALFRGPQAETFRCVLDFPRRESLSECVGVIFVIVGQFYEKKLDEAAKFGICIDHFPGAQEQPARLNEKLAQLDCSHPSYMAKP